MRFVRILEHNIQSSDNNHCTLFNLTHKNIQNNIQALFSNVNDVPCNKIAGEEKSSSDLECTQHQLNSKKTLKKRL